MRHGDLPEAFALHFRRISRAATRGRGPAKQATELPFDRLAELPTGPQPFPMEGTCYTRRFAVMATWWLRRETEAANLTTDCVCTEGTTAHLRLPLSKTDASGIGSMRSLGCCCAEEVSLPQKQGAHLDILRARSTSSRISWSGQAARRRSYGRQASHFRSFLRFKGNLLQRRGQSR